MTALSASRVLGLVVAAGLLCTDASAHPADSRGPLVVLVPIPDKCACEYEITETAKASTDSVPYREHDKWTAALAKGRPVEFRREPAAARTVADTQQDLPKHVVANAELLSDVIPLGPLTPEQKKAVRALLTSQQRAWEKRYRDLVEASAKSGNATMRDLQKELAAKKGVMRYQAALQQLEDDTYWAFAAKPGGEDMAKKAFAQIPKGWEKMLSRNATGGKGERIDIVFAIDPGKHSGVADIKEQAARVRDYRYEEHVQRINAMPFGPRKALIDRHLAAAAKLDAMAKAGDKDQAKIKQLKADMLPVRLRINRTNYTVSRR